MLASVLPFAAYTANLMGGLIDKAWDLMVEGKLDEAEAILLDILRREPTNFSARVSLGHLFLEKGALRSAWREFKNVVKEVLGEKEISSLNEGQRHAVSWAYLGLGDILIQRFAYPQAEIALMKADYASSNPAAYSLLGILARKYRKDLALSETIHKEIQQASPNEFAGNKIFLAIVYLYEGKRKEAEKIIEGIKDKETYTLELAAFYSVAGDAQKAFDHLKKSLDAYSLYPARRRQILEYLQRDEDFKNLRDFPPLQEFIRKSGVHPER